MDKPDNKDIGKLIKVALINHEVIPSGSVWEKLEQRLEAKKKPFGLIWMKWSAAAVIILSGFGLYLYRGEPVSQKDDFTTLTKSEFKNPSPYIPFQTDSLNEQVFTQQPAIPSVSGSDISVGSKEILHSCEASNETERLLAEGPSKEIKRLPSSSIAYEKETYLNKKLPTQVEMLSLAHHLEKREDPSLSATEPEVMDYKVKIVSRGFAFQPEKENFVGEIESKIGHFITKVDEGLAGIKDKKDHLFASLTTFKNTNR